MEHRIEKALNIAWRFGTIDGDHHKMWVIDQMVRALCGTEEKYLEWVKAYQTPVISGEHTEYYEWDTGITP